MAPLSDLTLTLTTTSYDSATPAGLAVVAHRFDTAGHYVLTSRRGTALAESRRLMVGTGTDVAGATPAGPGNMVIANGATLKLGSGDPPILSIPPAPISLPPGGYLSFTAAAGQAIEVTVARTDLPHSPAEPVFDTAKLGANDIFAVTLIRPGTYAMRNALGKYEGKIVVAYPDPAKPYSQAAPVDVQADATGFTPAAVTISPTQSVVFHISAAARITVDLVEPDDGPNGPAPSRTRATRPAASWRPGPPAPKRPTASDGPTPPAAAAAT